MRFSLQLAKKVTKQGEPGYYCNCWSRLRTLRHRRSPVARCPRKELVNHYRLQLAGDHRAAFTHADLCGEHIFVEPVQVALQ